MLDNLWYNDSMFRNRRHFLLSNNHHHIGVCFLNRTNRGGGFTLLRGNMDKIKELICQRFTKNSHSWHDYEKAKQLIQDYPEYDELIKFIVDWLGV